jgi:hypothetical protein
VPECRIACSHGARQKQRTTCVTRAQWSMRGRGPGTSSGVCCNSPRCRIRSHGTARKSRAWRLTLHARRRSLQVDMGRAATQRNDETKRRVEPAINFSGRCYPLFRTSSSSLLSIRTTCSCSPLALGPSLIIASQRVNPSGKATRPTQAWVGLGLSGSCQCAPMHA